MSDYNRKWIIDNGVPIVQDYAGSLTLRALHYQLVAIGMTNDIKHYKKVVSAMIQARWDGLVGFGDFQDHERETIGYTDYEETDVDRSIDMAERQIKAWATRYNKNRWENQEIYPEVFIEKKALQGVFEPVCNEWDVALNPCKGYPSLTFQHDASNRFQEAIDAGKTPIILYFGDYDCSGEDIPRSIGETLYKMSYNDIEVRRIALMEDQVLKWNLPPAPTKSGDSRAKNWDGLGQVELDAVKPEKIKSLCDNALQDLFDEEKYEELLAQEAEEREVYRKSLKESINNILD